MRITITMLEPRSRRKWLAVIAAVMTIVVGRSARAVRPFITDDARVVGRRSIQLETWIRGDRSSFQHWALVGFGPVAPLELTVGAVHGAANSNEPWHYSVAGPLFQAKLLLWEPRANRWPGLAIVGGMVGPLGTGAFATNGWDFFEYVALTESLGPNDLVLLHANVGVFGSTDPSHGGVIPTWGVGAQGRVYHGMNAVAELFSGDPYTGSGGGAAQFGFRYIVSQYVQIDGTAGVGLWGQPALPVWGTVGLRLASSALW